MEKFILINKKAQVWGFDLMIAVIIFFAGIIAVYLYAINFTNESQDTFDSLFYEGNLISSLILSNGVPENWSSLEGLEVPGILTSNKINQTKLENFYNLTDSPEEYYSLKKILGISNQFYFSFQDMKISGQSVDKIGNFSENPENLIRIERFTIYENKPVKFIFYIWN